MGQGREEPGEAQPRLPPESHRSGVNLSLLTFVRTDGDCVCTEQEAFSWTHARLLCCQGTVFILYYAQHR
jgi:hypothetical protein